MEHRLGSVDNCSINRSTSTFRGMSAESMAPADTPRGVEIELKGKQTLETTMETAGFTLLELLFSLVIFGLVCFFSLPFTAHFLHNNQLVALKNNIHTAIQFSRLQAFHHPHPLLLTPLGKDWSHGMRLCVSSTAYTCDAHSSLLHEWRWSYPALRVSWHGFFSDDFLIFSNDIQQSALNGTFTIKKNETAVVKLVLNRLGKIREIA